MQKIRGWLYIGKRTVSFIAEERFLSLEMLNWSMLADESKFKLFQKNFSTNLVVSKSSYKALSLEANISALNDWFELHSSRVSTDTTNL